MELTWDLRHLDVDSNRNPLTSLSLQGWGQERVLLEHKVKATKEHNPARGCDKPVSEDRSTPRSPSSCVPVSYTLLFVCQKTNHSFLLFIKKEKTYKKRRRKERKKGKRLGWDSCVLLEGILPDFDLMFPRDRFVGIQFLVRSSLIKVSHLIVKDTLVTALLARWQEIRNDIKISGVIGYGKQGFKTNIALKAQGKDMPHCSQKPGMWGKEHGESISL